MSKRKKKKDKEEVESGQAENEPIIVIDETFEEDPPVPIVVDGKTLTLPGKNKMGDSELIELGDAKEAAQGRLDAIEVEFAKLRDERNLLKNFMVQVDDSMKSHTEKTIAALRKKNNVKT